MPRSVRLRLLASIALACVVAAGPLQAKPGVGKNSILSVLRNLKNPVQADQPAIRYWLPSANVDIANVGRDMAEIARAGFGEVEIAFIPQNAGAMDPSRFGWGSQAWRHVLTQTAQAAAAHGLRFSLTIGPAWPVAVANLTPDSDGAAKELVVGWTVLHPHATSDGQAPLPRSPAAANVNNKHLIALQAWRCATDCTSDTDGLIHLKADSRIDLAGTVKDGRFEWSAPDEANWIVLSYWMRGTGQITALKDVAGNPAPTSPQAYVPNHFGLSGTKAIKSYWISNLLSPQLRALIRASGKAMFEDSIELESRLNWTAELPEEFARRRGYRIESQLPLVIVDEQRHFGMPRERKRLFAIDGLHADRDVYADYQLTLGELYTNYHLGALRAWANGLGMAFKAQPYGLPMDMVSASTRPDLPQAENLTLNNDPALLRIIATGAAVSGAPVISTECCSHVNANYRQTWRDLLSDIHSQYGAGINQVTLHGYPYTGAVATARWPGWSPFYPFGPSFMSPKPINGFSDAMGPRQPVWQDVRIGTRYIARLDAILRAGRPAFDVAILDGGLDHDGPLGVDLIMRGSGLTYGFVSAAMVDAGTLALKGNEIAAGKASFGSLYVPNSTTLGIRTREAIQKIQDAGGVVFWGNKAVQDLATGVMPRSRPVSIMPGYSSKVQVIRRVLGDGEIVVVQNGESVAQTIKIQIKPKMTLRRLNAWDASAKMLDVHNGQAGVDVAAGDLAIFVAKPAGGAVNSGLRQRPTKFSRTIKLTDWSLHIVPATVAKPEQGHAITVQHLSSLGCWSDQPSLADVSGRGRYKTLFDLSHDDASVSRVVLTLPQTNDFLRLWVNGKEVAVNPFLRDVDVTAFVRTGRNVLQISVSTTLNNALRIRDTVPFEGLARQCYGLVGPAVLTISSPR